MIDEIIDGTNLYFAWQKLKKALKPGDIWFDSLELFAFELNLDEEFKSIQDDIKNKAYELRKIAPVGFPKAPKNGDLVTRQTFNISIRDQLVWIAVVNVVGPYIDHKMPFWSYGNRLFRSVWYDEPSEGRERGKLNIGWYRHSGGFVYRKWNQSWPRYRRNIALTVRVMADPELLTNEEKQKSKITEQAELDEFEQRNDLPEELQVKYWKPDYWSTQASNITGKVYWGSIDLSKFYPSISTEQIHTAFEQRLQTKDPQVLELINCLLDFKIDETNWSEDELEQIDLKDFNSFHSLPTGLLVAGFLANMTFHSVDSLTNTQLDKNRNISHFRFVDDHVFLSTSFDALVDWIKQYQANILSLLPATQINLGKTEPKELRDYLFPKEVSDDPVKAQKDAAKAKNAAESATELDPEFPSPLMTQTLAKVSNINKTEFDLLDSQEEDDLILDLEHLMLADLPDHELRRDTRISFAATMLSRIVPRRIFESREELNLQVAIHQKIKLIEKYESDQKDLVVKSNSHSALLKKVETERSEVVTLIHQLELSKKQTNKQRELLNSRVFSLLLKAVRENHSKVRLWTRLIDYLCNSGHYAIDQVLNEVDQLVKNKKSSTLAAEFIYALIFEYLCEKIYEASIVMTSDRESVIRRRASGSFLKSIFSDSFFELLNSIKANSSKPYLKKSLHLIELSIAVGAEIIIECAEKHQTMEMELLDKANRCTQSLYKFNSIFNSTSSSIQENASNYWYLISKTGGLSYAPVNPYWMRYVQSVNSLDELNLNLVSLYPKNVIPSIQQLLKIKIDNKHPESLLQNIGWLREAGLVPRPTKAGYLTFTEWCEWTHDQQLKLATLTSNNKYNFDPRLTEWMGIKLIIQIIQQILERDPNDTEFQFGIFQDSVFSHKIHPDNYLIPESWTTKEFPTWHSLKSAFEDRANHALLNAPEDIIEDFRFVPTNTTYVSKEIKSVQGICTILVCLLSKKIDIPHSWNLRGQNTIALYSVARKISGLTISSATRKIIESCYSHRNIDTIFVRLTQTFIENDDTKRQVPPIVDLPQLKLALEGSIAILEKHQLEVQYNQPRQLIPIDILHLSNSKIMSPSLNQTQDGIE